jgi:DNA-binding response OmpR family regulator
MKEAARKRLALIDDDADFRRVVRLWLSGRYDVEAYPGAEELLAAREPAPDLVISDVKMPGLNGFKLCERLRADARYARVPFLFLTGVDSDEGFLLGFEAGADGYLAKPVERLRLLEKVAELLEKRRQPA